MMKFYKTKPKNGFFSTAVVLPALVVALVLGLIAAIPGCNTNPTREAAPNATGGPAGTRPAAVTLGTLIVPAIALSPDGARLVFVGSPGGTRQQLYLRSIEQTEARPLPGTDGAENPVFSPDGQWVAFFAEGKLKKAPVGGGSVMVLDDAPQARGLSWDVADTIVYSPSLNGGVVEIAPSGGAPKPLTDPKEERTHRWPALLPDGKAILYEIAKGDSWYEAVIVAQRLNTGERRVLVEGGTYPRFAPTGHLLYVRAGTLMAVRFDPVRLQVTGTAAPVLSDKVVVTDRTGAAQYTLSNNGTLVYLPERAGLPETKLVWVNRGGAVEPLAAPAGSYEHPRLSPDGQRVAVATAGPNANIFIYDIPGNKMTQLTSEATNTFPVWSPDGKRLAFRSTLSGPWNVYAKAADGSGAVERLTRSQYLNEPSSWSRDGQFLVFSELHPKTLRDVWVLPFAGDRKPRPVVRGPADEGGGVFSPDGRWIAYSSNESGHYEIYVQPFSPSGGTSGGRTQISTGGGAEVQWAPSGREIFYRISGKTMVAEVKTEPGFSASKPRMLFEGRFMGPLAFRPNYDVAPDGQRFLMLQAAEKPPASTQIKVAPRWSEELKQRVP